MSIVPEELLTPAEYLDIERKADFRSEYLRGEMFAMARASFEHTLIKDNFAREAGNQHKGSGCRVLTSDMRVKVSVTGLYTYPDIAIVCGEPQFEDVEFDTLLNPQVIIEVLSDSTEKYDRGAKFGHYRKVASLQEHILIAQDKSLVERFVRQSDGSWVLTVFDKLSDVFDYGTIAAKVALTAIYDGVELPES